VDDLSRAVARSIRASTSTPALHESGSGGGRGEAIRTIYYSDRQLPQGNILAPTPAGLPPAGSVAHGH
jgi:hypothetical protein